MRPGPEIPSRAHRADASRGAAWAGVGGRICAPIVAPGLALLVGASALAATPEFVADATYLAPPPGSRAKAAEPPGASARLYVGKDKMRVDFAGLNPRSLIVDDSGRSIAVRYHDRRAYQLLGSRPAEYLRVADAENACPAWQQAVGAPVRCQMSDSELVAERRTARSTRSVADGSSDEIWADPTLQYVVKWRIGSVDMDLRNTSEGPQPASLFVIADGCAPLGPRQTTHRQRRRS